ncbi:MAG: class II aldolase/adducin family protein, partial [Ilumatobacteraceae bacterium]
MAIDDQPIISFHPETFDDPEAERAHRKAKLAGALRIFGRLGFAEGVAGHITVRDPIMPDHFWVNPLGKSFRHMRSSDLLLVSHEGEIVVGDRPVNRAAFVLHSAIHKARPEVISASHSHS